MKMCSIFNKEYGKSLQLFHHSLKVISHFYMNEIHNFGNSPFIFFFFLSPGGEGLRNVRSYFAISYPKK